MVYKNWLKMMETEPNSTRKESELEPSNEVAMTSFPIAPFDSEEGGREKPCFTKDKIPFPVIQPRAKGQPSKANFPNTRNYFGHNKYRAYEEFEWTEIFSERTTNGYCN